MKQIEMLVAMNIPIEMFINALTKNQFVSNLSNFYNKKISSSKKNIYILNYGNDSNHKLILILNYKTLH